MSALLELDSVTKLYPGKPPVVALDEVSFTVEEGELVAIVGRSGSGKSTLMNVIGTLARPTSGTVRLDGGDVAEASDSARSGWRASHFGFVFQQFHLLPGLSSAQNVALGLSYRRVAPRERIALAHAALAKVGLADRSHHKPSELSGGEKQRVAIARAVVGEPRLVLADEPTGNLDSKTGADIINLIRELNNQGSTILVITHDKELAMSLPRRIEVADGQILSDTITTGLNSHVN